MNLITAVKSYVVKMTEESTPGMKILLMDKETTSIISMVYSQSEIQQKEVFLLERLDTDSQGGNNAGLRFLCCLVFVRPTQKNIELLSKELRNPRFGSYYLYFSNIVPKADVKILAENDEQEVVKGVHEFYMDYLAVGPHLFSVGVANCLTKLSWQGASLTRTVQAIAGVLLSLKRCPLIRYQKNSETCKELAQKVDELISKESSLFAFGQNNQPILIILDRRDDPVTPLLNQWTYQAMVHELLTIGNNRVNLSNVAGISKEMSEVVLSAEQDPFYAKNIFLNFGEIGQNIKKLMEHFQAKAKSHQKVESIADMKAFVETYPQFKKLSGNVAKHVTVIGELSSLVSKHSLLDVSEVEQEMASQIEHSHLQRVQKLIGNSSVKDLDAAKLVALYALTCGNHNTGDLKSLFKSLKLRGIPNDLLFSIINVIEYGGNRPKRDLLNPEDAVKITKRFFKGLSGVENVYTQHKPVLHETLEELLRGRLREDLFPYVGGNRLNGRPQDVIVFMVGGTTYEESLTVHNFNKTFTGSHVILGGTSIHNSKSFLEEVNETMKGINRKYTRHIPVHFE